MPGGIYPVLVKQERAHCSASNTESTTNFESDKEQSPDSPSVRADTAEALCIFHEQSYCSQTIEQQVPS